MVHVPPDVAHRTRTHAGPQSRYRRLAIGVVLALLSAADAAAAVVPRERFAEPVSRFVGAVWYASRPGARAAVRDNLRHVLGREPTRREVVRVFHHGALNYWDTFALPHFSQQQLVDLVDIHGLEHIDRAREIGRGVVCVGAHLGSVALVAQVLPVLGYPIVGVIERFEPVEVFEFFSRQRQALGTRLYPTGSGAVRELLLALRRNELVGLVTDRDVTGTGPFIQFFDARTRFPDGAAWLALRTGAPIIVSIATRKASGRFDAWFEPLPTIELDSDTKLNALRVTQVVAERLQYYVANHPQQWTVFQRRWPEA